MNKSTQPTRGGQRRTARAALGFAPPAAKTQKNTKINNAKGAAGELEPLAEN